MTRKQRILFAIALMPAVILGLLLSSPWLTPIAVNAAIFVGAEIGVRLIRRRYGIANRP